MNLQINWLSDKQPINIESNIDRFRSIINNLVWNDVEIDNIVDFFIDKVDFILETNLLSEKLMIEWYEIIWFWEFKELPNWEFVLKINVSKDNKKDTLYLNSDFKIFKTESWRKVFHIGKVVDVIKKEKWEKNDKWPKVVVWKGTWIIIENWLWTVPVLLIYKKWIMLNTYPPVNPFTKERK